MTERGEKNLSCRTNKNNLKENKNKNEYSMRNIEIEKRHPKISESR